MDGITLGFISQEKARKGPSEIVFEKEKLKVNYSSQKRARNLKFSKVLVKKSLYS